MKKYKILKQILNTDKLEIIELYLKGKETGLNPEIDESELLSECSTLQEAWIALERYTSAIKKQSGGHRLTEYVIEEVTYDEDGEPEEYKTVDRAPFAELSVYRLAEVSAEAPAAQNDWKSGMVYDADPAHTVVDYEPMEWFLSLDDALEELKGCENYVGGDKAHEFVVETYKVGDLTDDDTWECCGEAYFAKYAYVKVYAESPYRRNKRFVELFSDMDDANYCIDESWQEDNLVEGERVLHFMNLDGEEIERREI